MHSYTLITIVLQALVVVVARLLQTSMASAVADGDPEATAPGYLFGNLHTKARNVSVFNIIGILMNNYC